MLASGCVLLGGAGALLGVAVFASPVGAGPADASCIYLGLGCRSPSPPPLPTPLPGPLYPPAPIAQAPQPPYATDPADVGTSCGGGPPARPRKFGC